MEEAQAGVVVIFVLVLILLLVGEPTIQQPILHQTALVRSSGERL